MKTQAGFTLIELMIVVAVIGILASIAYPSYVDAVRKTRFAQAKEGAMQVATALDRKASQEKEYLESMPAAPYTDLLKYSYSRPSSAKGTFSLTVVEQTERFKIWVGINSRGAKCGCSGASCASPGEKFTAILDSCNGLGASIEAF